MSLQISKITQKQWEKVLKALYYSAASGFSAGFLLSIANSLTNGNVDFTSISYSALLTGAVIAGAVAACNSLAVTVKQLFTSEKG